MNNVTGTFNDTTNQLLFVVDGKEIHNGLVETPTKLFSILELGENDKWWDDMDEVMTIDAHIPEDVVKDAIFELANPFHVSGPEKVSFAV